MNETTITRQIMKDWKRQNGSSLWSYKIPDPRFGSETNDRAVDIVACYDGVFIGIEWKITKNSRALPIDGCGSVRLGQLATLCDIEAAGGIGFVAVVVYHGPHDKCVYMVPIFDWNRMVAVIDTKSVHVEKVFPQWKIVQRRVGPLIHWDFQTIERYIDARRHRTT
ncbi:MAG: hypothetical protein WC052_04775 [Patescibacteria group bacterium]|jgi:penicillin-binding protein-related factor A (putative recombinase)